MSNQDNRPHTQEHVSEEHQIRVEKVKHLAEQGISAWSAAEDVKHTAQEALSTFSDNPETKETFSIAGRLLLIRDHGKTFFAKLQDRSGSIQIYINQKILSPELFAEFKRDIDLGDIIFIQGTMFTTRTGEKNGRSTLIQALE